MKTTTKMGENEVILETKYENKDGIDYFIIKYMSRVNTMFVNKITFNGVSKKELLKLSENIRKLAE